jgi:hypothetical protein
MSGSMTLRMRAGERAVLMFTAGYARNTLSGTRIPCKKEEEETQTKG